MGADYVLDAVGIDDRLAAAQCAISGEGKIDEQSSMGKVIGALGCRAEPAEVPLHAIVGCDGRGSGGPLEVLASVTEASTLAEIEEAARTIAAPLTAEPHRIY